MLIKYMIIKIYIKIPLNSTTQRLPLLTYWLRFFKIFFLCIYKFKSDFFLGGACPWHAEVPGPGISLSHGSDNTASLT